MISREELLKKIVVKITVESNGQKLEGSGVLLKNKAGECFVITAEHCIFGKRSSRLSSIPKLSEITIKYKKFNSDNFRQLKVKRIKYSCPNLDVAICSIEEQNSTDDVIVTSFNSNISFKSLCFRGYPKWLRNEEAKTYDCQFEEYDNPKFTIKSSEIQDLTSNKEIDLTAHGLSGSGLFQFKNAKLFFLGIVTDLRCSDGLFGQLQCTHIGSILESLDFDVISLNYAGDALLAKSEEIDEIALKKKIERFKNSEVEQYNNLHRKCKVLYPEQADVMALKLLEKYFEAEIAIKKKIAIDGFIQEDFDQAKFGLKEDILLFYNNRSANNSNIAQGIYKEIIDTFIDAFKEISRSTVDKLTIKTISHNAVNEYLLNCDLNFKQHD